MSSPTDAAAPGDLEASPVTLAEAITSGDLQAPQVALKEAVALGALHGPTELMFESPQDPRTSDYVHGRFG